MSSAAAAAEEEYIIGEGLSLGVTSKSTRCKWISKRDMIIFQVPETGEMNEICLKIVNSNNNTTFDVSVSYEDYTPSVYRLDPSGTLEVDRYTDSNWPLALYSPTSGKYHNVKDSQRGKVSLVATKVTTTAHESKQSTKLSVPNNVIPDHESPEYSTKSLFNFEQTLPGIPVKGSIPLNAVVFLSLLVS